MEGRELDNNKSCGSNERTERNMFDEHIVGERKCDHDKFCEMKLQLLLCSGRWCPSRCVSESLKRQSNYQGGPKDYQTECV